MPKAWNTYTDPQQVIDRYVPDRVAGVCWEWKGCIEKDGYGVVQYQSKQIRAHRLIYEALVGPIPEGMQLDHLCRNRACVNPEHLDVVTCKQNIERSERATSLYCKNGHPFFGPNLRIHVGTLYSSRVCRTCTRLRMRGYRLRKALL